MRKGVVTGIPEETLHFLTTVQQKSGAVDRMELMAQVCNELENQWPDEEDLEFHSNRLCLATTTDILAAIDLIQKQKHESFQEVLSGANQMIEQTPALKREKGTITDGALGIVNAIVLQTHSTDRSYLVEKICEELSARYHKNNLEYHLTQMNLLSKQDILRVIDIYFIMRRVFPEMSFKKIKPLKVG